MAVCYCRDGLPVRRQSPRQVVTGPGVADMEMGRGQGHGSNASPFLDGSCGSWVTASDPLTHDDEIHAIACDLFCS